MRPVVLSALLALAIPASVAGQNPAVDQPWRRPVLAAGAAPIGADDPEPCVAEGFALWQRGLDWQAWRCFREAVQRDDDAALGWLGIALAALDAAPRRAAEAAYAAHQRRERVAAPRRGLIDALASALDATARPDPTAARFDTAVTGVRRAVLRQRLAGAAAAAGEDPIAAAIAARLAGGAGPALALDAAGDRARVDAWLAEPITMPFAVAGLDAAVGARIAGLEAAGGAAAARLLVDEVLRWPRHPRFPLAGLDRLEAAASRLAGVAAPAAADAPLWVPPPAPSLDVVRGLGGRRRLEDFGERPVLVVFFLGFGCVHCVEQLHALLPAVEAFRGNGIEIVAVGTDDAAQVKASFQMAQENGTPTLPFDVLCDPAAEAFRAWTAYDEFAGEPLHGTFLVDAGRRVLWADIGVEPFMDAPFLLRECKRLLAAWR